ncbi:hypothetical protein BCR44DRAFT_1013399 [Catenaria anguillulae PL171]|uniref:Uncharacterized protein n=1 Tax=Catenaria anguillulae PL171 TaxID=765915 RepID=A0A1Y2I4F5_9FUNG|nr:hypothetical protein BCR44DRAFT_1013399 [Catenaria anguillulae PL171]
MDVLVLETAISLIPSAWLLSSCTAAVCQVLWLSRHRHRQQPGYIALPQADNHGPDHLIEDDHDHDHDGLLNHDGADESMRLVVPSLTESLASVLQSLVMAAFTIFALLTHSLSFTQSMTWAIASVIAAVDVPLRRKPVSKHSPPQYLHVSRGFILGGFLVFALNDAVFMFLSAWPSFNANDHRAWILLLAPVVTFLLHVIGHRSSYVDLPNFPRFPAASAWEGLTLRWMWPTVRKSMQVNRLEITDCADFLPDDQPANVFPLIFGIAIKRATQLRGQLLPLSVVTLP